MSDFENHERVKAFGAAETLIKGTFQSLKVSFVLYTMYVPSVKHSHTAWRGMGPEGNGAI